MSDLTIHRMMVLSTTHLGNDAYTGLGTLDRVEAWETTSGWIMRIPDNPYLVRASDHGWPPEILPIMKFVHAHYCDYVRFDTHGDTVEQLPVFTR